MKNRPDELSFFDHLDELRSRFIKCLIAVVVTTSVAFIFVDQMMAFLVKPVGQLVFTSPADAFFARLTLAFFCGCILALPVILLEIWQFVAVALNAHEHKIVAIYVPVSLFLFLLGGFFAYQFAIPLAIRFLLGFSTAYVVPMITINNYISFVGVLLFAFGIVFELPLVMLFLASTGIATPAFLTQKRKHAVVMICILSALITPPDVITLMIMAGPLIILYEIGLLVARLAVKRKSVEDHSF